MKRQVIHEESCLFNLQLKLMGLCGEISFGWRLHGLDPICHAPCGPRGQCGLLMEVFHLKHQKNFLLTHDAVPDMWHQWTRGNPQGRLRLVRTCSRPHILQTVSKRGQNLFVSWAPGAIPVCITYFLESLKSQQLSLFPSACPCSNWELGATAPGLLRLWYLQHGAPIHAWPYVI